MNPTLQRYLISSATTFVASFLLTLGGEISQGAITSWSGAILLSVIAVAVRAAVKAVMEAVTPVTGDPQPKS